MPTVALVATAWSKSGGWAGVRPPVLSLTESQVNAAIRSVLMGMVPGLPVVKGQANLVPEIGAADFMVFVPRRRSRLSTNQDTFAAFGFAGYNSAEDHELIDVQLDIHGPNSADNLQIVKTLWRDPYSVDAFSALGLAIAPLYADDGDQIPFENAENQWEFRWVLTLTLQANFVITTPQQFANRLQAGLISVDATYPP
jgi:hypothetical protein